MQKNGHNGESFFFHSEPGLHLVFFVEFWNVFDLQKKGPHFSFELCKRRSIFCRLIPTSFHHFDVLLHHRVVSRKRFEILWQSRTQCLVHDFVTNSGTSTRMIWKKFSLAERSFSCHDFPYDDGNG